MGLHRRLLRVRHAFQAALLLAVPAAGAATAATTPPAAPAAGIALVIGNATYTALPPLPACALSAHAVAAALRRIGFDVIEREDATLGEVDGAIGSFSTRLAAAPTAPAIAYLCGYAAGLNDRSFYLPVSATLARPTDVLTQGVLTASLLHVLAPRRHAAVLALDLAARPGAPAQADLGSPGSGPLPDALGMVVVRETGAGTTPTPLAAALVAGLAGPRVQSGELVGGLDTALAKARPAVTVVALHSPATSLALAGAPAAPAETPPAVTTPALTPPGQAPAPSTAATPAATLPAEADMTDAERRQVQTALARLGYYDGKVDGLFGPDTRAAIRRFQHELHAPMTGILTAGEATNLASRNLR
jgi:Putative peptidoglycan binding domain/Caspase domain